VDRLALWDKSRNYFLGNTKQKCCTLMTSEFNLARFLSGQRAFFLLGIRRRKFAPYCIPVHISPGRVQMAELLPKGGGQDDGSWSRGHAQ
jgi:hypothetical protein